MGAAAHRSPPHHRNWHSARQTSLARLRRGDVNGWGRGLAVSGTCCSANCESCGLVQLADDASFGSETGVGIDLRPASHRARRPQMCPAAGVLCFKSCFLLSRAPVCPPPLFFFFLLQQPSKFSKRTFEHSTLLLKNHQESPSFSEFKSLRGPLSGSQPLLTPTPISHPPFSPGQAEFQTRHAVSCLSAFAHAALLTRNILINTGSLSLSS